MSISPLTFKMNTIKTQLAKSLHYIIIFLTFCSATSSFASHYTFGGEMWALHIGNEKYVLTNKIYRICGGISPRDSVYVTASAGTKGACGSITFSAGLQSTRFVGTKCSTANDCSAGFQINELIYKCTVDLKSTPFVNLISGSSCKTLTFSAYGYLVAKPLGTCYNQDAYFSTVLYLNNLSNCSSTTNMAPALMFDPIRNMYVSRTMIFSQGLVDTAERDVLRFQLSPTQLGTGPCNNTPTGDYNHPFTPTCVAATTCAPNLKTSPVRGSFFDTLDGTYIFSPSVLDEIGNVCTKVYEYRINKNGVYTLIAMHTREVAGLTIDLNGANEPPRSLTQKSTIKICVGNTVSQKFVDFDDVVGFAQSTADSLVVITMPNYRGASIKQYISAKNKRSLEFNWTPRLKDTFADGYVFPIKVIDQHCNPPLANTFNLTVKVYPTPSGLPQLNYKGCNILALDVKNFTGGSSKKCSWQIVDAKGSTVGTSLKTRDSIRLNGSGTYKILALLSNEGGCFKYWDSTIKIVDTVIDFSIGQKSPIADTLNCPNSSINIIPKISISPTGKLTYQWFGLESSKVALGEIPGKINLANLAKIGNTTNLNVKTSKDTSVLLRVTDAKGCSEIKQLNIIQVISAPIVWKQKPLPPVCGSDPPLKLINPTSKDMLDGGINTGIRCLNGKHLDSLGPNYYKLTPPTRIKNIEKITLSLVARYDTLGCVSSDTNSIDILYKPTFEISKNINLCSTDSSFYLNDAIVKPAKNAKPYEWKIIGMPLKSIAQLGNLNIGGKSGLHLITHLDSIATGTYKITSCAVDSTLGCRSCDTTTIVSRKPITFKYTGDTLFCPNTPPVLLRNKISLSSNEGSDSIYNLTLYDFNGNKNPSNNIKNKLLDVNGLLNPRIAVGRANVFVASSNYCYANGLIGLSILDTLSIAISTTPDTLIRLPKTSFTFTASSSSSKIWWNFGTSNPADTSILNPITWAFDSKMGNYRVIIRSYNTNGCYGEAAQIVQVLDVSATKKFIEQAKISNKLVLIGQDWKFLKLELFDVQGKKIFTSIENNGVPNQLLSAGAYIYKFTVSHNGTVIEHQGKWINSLD